VTASVGLRGDFWPTEREEALLGAALLPRREAMAAWEKARPGLDIDRMPGPALRILPLVYRRLDEAGVEDPFLPRLKGLYRRTWYHNQLQIHRAASVIRTLEEEEIPTMVLKGAAMIARYYGDAGVRPMGDVDVLVPTERGAEALRVLEAADWRRPDIPQDLLLRHHHGIGFVDADGNHVDLHWQVSTELVLAGARERSCDVFWDGSVETEIGGLRTRALDPADQLLHLVVHGGRSYSGTSLQWVADAATVLDFSEDRFDWARLVREASRRRMFLHLRDGLIYLRRGFRAPVPDGVSAELGSLPATRRDVFVHWAITRHHSRWMGTFLYGFARYLRLHAHRGPLGVIAGLPRFLQDRWEARHLWEVPVQALARTVRRIARWLTPSRRGGVEHQPVTD